MRVMKHGLQVLFPKECHKNTGYALRDKTFEYNCDTRI